MPRPDGVIFVDTPPEVAAARVQERRSRIGKTTDEGAKIAALEKSAEVAKMRLDKALSVLEEYGVPVLRLDGIKSIRGLGDETVGAFDSGFFG